jgi:hypothetical protein
MAFDNMEEEDLKEDTEEEEDKVAVEKTETVMVESEVVDMVAVREVEEQLRTRNQNNNT